MGKKVKTGKSRQDKFYKLAKETGYRSRAAFKLIQLNRKFGFLLNSRVCVDLCAAPGGWLQVAHQNMPLSSLIVGVDLVPIKQVGSCVTFAEDIKTDKCRQALRKELKTWEVDVVLHDGAPNVGKNWLHDAFQQNELTLSALKLATEFTKKGGWFVTKVFRSKDYHALMWLFKKLFKKVFATKPQASRHESAEIFVVCQGFLKPDKIDARLLDPKHVFKEMEREAAINWEKGNQVSQLFKVIEKSKQKAHGYENDSTMVFKKISVQEFLVNETFAEILATHNVIEIDDSNVDAHEATTTEVRACCADLKVLGRKELKLLINWRKKLLKGADREKPEEKMEVDPATEDGKKEDDLESLVAATEEAERKESKKKKKKESKKKQKLRERIALKMVHVGDRFDETQDEEMFDLKRIGSEKGLKVVVEGDRGAEDDAEVEDDEAEIRPKKKRVRFQRDDVLEDADGAKRTNREYVGEAIDNAVVESEEDESEDDLHHEDDLEMDSDDDEEDDVDDDVVDDENPLIQPLTGDKNAAERLKRKTSVWFAKDIFDEVDEDEEFEIGRTTTSSATTATPLPDSLGSDGEKEEVAKLSDVDDSDSDSEDEDVARNGGDSFETVPQTENEVASSGKNRKRQLLDPEGLAIASFIIQSNKNRREIEESGFNKWTNNDKNLPDWFQKDQRQHWRQRIPVQITKDMVDEYKKRQMAIDARPIKKVAEAKARKKRKAAKQMEKLKKKAEAVVDKEGASEKEKALEIKRMYKKAIKRGKTSTKLVVAKKGGQVKGSKPSKGTKYKVVDPRMKKDKRAAEKKLGKKGQKGKAGKNSSGKRKSKSGPEPGGKVGGGKKRGAPRR